MLEVQSLFWQNQKSSHTNKEVVYIRKKKRNKSLLKYVQTI